MACTQMRFKPLELKLPQHITDPSPYVQVNRGLVSVAVLLHTNNPAVKNLDFHLSYHKTLF